MVQFQEEAPFRPTGWRNRRALNGGGVFIDGGIHKVDLLLYLAGMPARLYAVPLPPGLPGLEAEDGVVVTTRSAQGVVGLMTHAWTNARHPPAPWVAVSGTRGRIAFEVGAPGSHSMTAGRSASGSSQRMALGSCPWCGSFAPVFGRGVRQRYQALSGSRPWPSCCTCTSRWSRA